MLADVEKNLGCMLDEMVIFDFLLECLKYEDNALEELDLALMCLSDEWRGKFGEGTAELGADPSDHLLYMCRDYGRLLWQELQDAGAYKDGELTFKYVGKLLPKTIFLHEKDDHRGRLPETAV